MSLLERDRPLADLLTAADRAVDGVGGIAAVAGEAGIGKTTLLHALTSEVGARMRVLWAGCEALFTPRPLGPLHDIAPELGLDADLPRERLFPAAVAAVQRVPTLLVVEDVHWADHATLDFLRYAVRRIAGAPLLLALSYRDDELHRDHPLLALFGEAGAAVCHVSLAPLSRETVERLAAGRAGVFELTRGNPFYVTEVLAHARADIPPIVRDAVLARFAKLSREARDLVERASVIPGRAEAELIDASDEAVEEAVRRGIVNIEGQAIVFRHELTRRAVESSLSELRRAAMHRAALAKLIERGEPSLARLAHHAAGACDAEAIRRLAPLAAEEAARAGAHSEAAAHLRVALRYAMSADAARAALLESLAYECYLGEQLEEAFRCRVEATAIRHELGDKRREGDNLRWQSRLLFRLGRVAESRRTARQAVDILQNDPSRELADAYNNQAQLHMLAQECDAAVEWGMRAIDLATHLGRDDIVAHARNNVGSARAMANDPIGLEEIEQALHLSLDRGFHEHAARSYGNRAALAVWLREYARAGSVIAEGLQYCQERDIVSWQIYITAWRARLNMEQGRLDAAADDARAVLDRGDVSRLSRAFALTVLATVHMRRGDPEAQPLLEEAQQLAQRMPELRSTAVVALARAEAAWLRGDSAAAVDELSDAITHGGVIATRHDLKRWMWRASGRGTPPPARATGDPYDEALALSDAGDIPSLQRAMAILQGLHDGSLVDIVRQKLRALGVLGARRASTGAHPAGLTAREVEILHLLDEGLRDADIARRLHVSPKTVGHHVSSVLAKLNVRSRGEAARIFRSQKTNDE